MIVLSYTGITLRINGFELDFKTQRLKNFIWGRIKFNVVKLVWL